MPDPVPNKIKFGIKGCYYAVATIAANNSATYGTPVALPGAVNLSLSPQGETNSFYADNIDYYTTVSNTGYEGDLELARLPESFLKDVLGYKVDSNGVLYEDANAPTVPFALIYQFEGDVDARRCVLYRCTASRPEISAATKEQNIEPQTEKIPLKIGAVYNAGLEKDLVRAIAAPAQATQYNGWNSAVYQPSAPAA